MPNYISLKILDKLRAIFETLGCEYDIMREILQVKLTMDKRRKPTVLGTGRNRKRAEGKNSFIASLWIYGLMSLITVPFVLMDQNYIFQMSIVFGMLMFLVTTSMISDFSSVLLDIRDRVIVATKPVRKRTMSCARFVHITIYMSLITGSLTGLPLIAALFAHGFVFFLIFLFEIVLMDIFIMVFTALLYVSVLHLFDGEKLKDIINYVQIALSMSIVIGYQLIGRAFSLFKVHIVFHAAWWQIFVPPFWFGSTFQVLMTKDRSMILILFCALAWVIPMILFAIYIRLMPTYEKKLQRLAEEDFRNRPKSHLWTHFRSRMVCRREQERIWFDFALVNMARERDFKLKVYPSLGFSIIFPFIIIFQPVLSSKGLKSSSGLWDISIYFCTLVIPATIMMLKYSSKHQASWIYLVAPLRDYQMVYKGTVKAFLYKLFAPVYLTESLIFVFIFGLHAIWDLAAAGLAILLFTGICMRLVGKSLPFSEPYQMAQNAKPWLAFLLILLIGVFAAVHFGIRMIPGGIYVYIGVLMIINFVMWRYGFRIQKKTV